MKKVLVVDWENKSAYDSISKLVNVKIGDEIPKNLDGLDGVILDIDNLNSSDVMLFSKKVSDSKIPVIFNGGLANALKDWLYWDGVRNSNFYYLNSYHAVEECVNKLYG